jgi:hypothetical protein
MSQSVLEVKLASCVLCSFHPVHSCGCGSSEFVSDNFSVKHKARDRNAGSIDYVIIPWCSKPLLSNSISSDMYIVHRDNPSPYLNKERKRKRFGVPPQAHFQTAPRAHDY